MMQFHKGKYEKSIDVSPSALQKTSAHFANDQISDEKLPGQFVEAFGYWPKFN